MLWTSAPSNARLRMSVRLPLKSKPRMLPSRSRTDPRGRRSTSTKVRSRKLRYPTPTGSHSNGWDSQRQSSTLRLRPRLMNCFGNVKRRGVGINWLWDPPLRLLVSLHRRTPWCCSALLGSRLRDLFLAYTGGRLASARPVSISISIGLHSRLLFSMRMTNGVVIHLSRPSCLHQCGAKTHHLTHLPVWGKAAGWRCLTLLLRTGGKPRTPPADLGLRGNAPRAHVPSPIFWFNFTLPCWALYNGR